MPKLTDIKPCLDKSINLRPHPRGVRPKLTVPLASKPAVSYEDYAAYIASEEWQKTRRRYYTSRQERRDNDGNWRCYCCLSSSVPLDLHHRTYKRLGREHLKDFVPLCRTCHKHVHDLHGIVRKDLWHCTGNVRKLFAKHGEVTPAELNKLAARMLRG
jgi:hypothetical protein